MKTAILSFRILNFQKKGKDSFRSLPEANII